MNTSAISKITRGGQVTLPKSIRATRHFSDAHAVEFIQKNDMVVVRPIKTTSDKDRSAQKKILDYTMREWADTAHDDLFDFS